MLIVAYIDGDTIVNAQERRFIFNSPTRDIQTFEAIAQQAARLLKYAQVIVNISELAVKGYHEIPEGGSGWHEYAVHSPGLHRVFPHPLIEPHVPREFVERNQALMRAKSAVLSKLGIGAGYWGVEPFFIGESFWREHPHLRGPRVDHPRRSRKEEFSLCVDLPECQAMIAQMAGQLRRAIPNLASFTFKTNDAGGSLCWANALYSGVQGPEHCQSLSPGTHVANLVNAIHRGLTEGGGVVPMFIVSSNFWGGEIYDIIRLLPANTHLVEHDDAMMTVGSMIGGYYPVRGLYDPLALIERMERYHRQGTRTVFMNFRASYERATETSQTIGSVLDIMEHSIAHPTRSLMERLQSLQTLVQQWTSAENAEDVFEALVAWRDAVRQRAGIAGRLTTLYCGVSTRHITRPLVWKPTLLTEDEESYFLPHVFNVDRTEAREDYVDVHGGRVRGPMLEAGMPAGWAGVLGAMERAAGVLENAKADPGGEALYQLGTAIRIVVCISRSVEHFYFGQLLRDKYADRLAGEPKPVKHVPGGTEDLYKWNALQRKELDNTQQLIDLLVNRGMEQIAHAADAAGEDTFVLGPNLIDDLKRKIRIMRNHWLDAEGYLQPPHR